MLEHLEPRLPLTAVPTGDIALVHSFSAGPQALDEAPAAIAGSPSNRLVVYEGRGFEDRAGVFLNATSANGAANLGADQTDAIRVNDTITGEQTAPQIAADPTGRSVVVWQGRGAGDKTGVFFALFDASATRVLIDGARETLVNETIGGVQSHPAVAMAADGSFAVAWHGVGSGDVSGVYLRLFDAAGAATTGEILVNTTTEDHQSHPTLAYQTNGTLVVAWQSLGQDGDGWGVYSQRFAADGTPEGDETRVATTTAGSQTHAHLAAAPSGGVVTSWNDRGATSDDADVIARAFASSGTPTTDDVTLNSITDGVQRDATLRVAADGRWLAAWSSGLSDGAGWEAMVREFSSNGVGDGEELPAGGGHNSGHQHPSSIAVAGAEVWAAWSGDGPDDKQGVYVQGVETGLDTTIPQEAPNLEPIASIADAAVGDLLTIPLTASDANVQDTLTFALDPDATPPGMTLTQETTTTATLRWTPPPEAEDQSFTVRVLVTDNGAPPLADAEEFVISVATGVVTVDANGSDTAGINTQVSSSVSTTPVLLTTNASVRLSSLGTVTGATARLTATPDSAAERLEVDTLDTAITANYDDTTGELTLSGADTEANYERVLQTLAYANQASAPSGERVIEIVVADGVDTSDPALVTLTIVDVDLVAFAQALTDANAQFFGAGWCPQCTVQKELFEDGGQFLPFVEVTNPDRSLNSVGQANNISVFPTWVFDDGTRVEGVQTLEQLSTLSGVAIPESSTPFIAPLDDGDGVAGQRLIVGSPLHVPLDGYDPNGGVLTYDVTSNRADVTAEILTGNRSARIDVEGYGEMVFELFEGQADRATERMITLAGQDFYDDIIFHRIIDGFVIQGGDPTGTGAGGSTLGDFDDQFDPDLQHNRSGILSMAKAGDDTNDSQFFITEGPTRSLDFQHTVFGLLVEGEGNRESISNTATNSQDRPTIDVVMDTVDIFTDTENAVLLVKADDGATGSAVITVTVTDEDGNQFVREITLALTPDNETIVDDPQFGRIRNGNGRPYLEDIGPIVAPSNTTAVATLPAFDIEGDPFFYSFNENETPAGFAVSIDNSGELSVAPPPGFVGVIDFTVAVGDRDDANNFNRFNVAEDFQRITVEFT